METLDINPLETGHTDDEIDQENDDLIDKGLGYESEVYYENGDADENNDSTRNIVKRGLTRLAKFRREYGKPGGIKLTVTFDAMNRLTGQNRSLFSSFLGDMVREHIGVRILSWKKVDSEARDKMWEEITVRIYFFSTHQYSIKSIRIRMKSRIHNTYMLTLFLCWKHLNMLWYTVVNLVI